MTDPMAPWEQVAASPQLAAGKLVLTCWECIVVLG